jgi:hypothetical protein
MEAKADTRHSRGEVGKLPSVERQSLDAGQTDDFTD